MLKLIRQKEPQEVGWGGEGGMADNIGGEVGSIPPYPTFIPPGPNELFCLFFFLLISHLYLLLLPYHNRCSWKNDFFTEKFKLAEGLPPLIV